MQVREERSAESEVPQVRLSGDDWSSVESFEQRQSRETLMYARGGNRTSALHENRHLPLRAASGTESGKAPDLRASFEPARSRDLFSTQRQVICDTIVADRPHCPSEHEY
jgi:hypothetical protein